MWRQARLSSFAVLDSRVDILSDAVFAWWSPSPIPFSSSLQSIIPNRLQMGHIVERCEDCTILIFFAFTEICFEFKQTVCLAQNHTEHNAWELNKTHCLTTRKGNDEWENIEFWEMFFVKKKRATHILLRSMNVKKTQKKEPTPAWEWPSRETKPSSKDWQKVETNDDTSSNDFEKGWLRKTKIFNETWPKNRFPRREIKE